MDIAVRKSGNLSVSPMPTLTIYGKDDLMKNDVHVQYNWFDIKNSATTSNIHFLREEKGTLNLALNLLDCLLTSRN